MSIRYLFIVILLAAPRSVRADEALEQALATRNAELDKKFDEQAAAQRARMDAEATTARSAATERNAADLQVRTSVEKARQRAKRNASLKTGIVLESIGLALVAAGAISWYSASQTKDAIDTGGFATGSEIGDAEREIQIKQGVAYTAGGAGGLLSLIGAVYLW